MAKLTLDGLKTKLTTNQLRAAELLLEKEYAPKGEKKLTQKLQKNSVLIRVHFIIGDKMPTLYDT